MIPSSWRDNAWTAFERAAVGFAFGRAILGFFCYPLLAYFFPDGIDSRSHIAALQVVLYGGSALLLYRLASSDDRARYVAAVLIFSANAYATGFIHLVIAKVPAPWSWIFTVAWGIRAEAFLPFFLWKFIEVFPNSRVSHPYFSAANILKRTALGLGIFLNVLALIRVFRFLASFTTPVWVDGVVLLLDKQWEILIPLIVAIAPFLWLKRRRLSVDERRRIFLVVVALGAFCYAMFEVLLEVLFPSLPIWKIDRIYRFYFGNLFFAAFPLLLTYSVLAHRVLDVASVARNAIRYVLTRYSAVALGFVPFVFIVYFGWIHRHSTLVELFSGSPAIVLSTAALLGALALIYRQPVLDSIDRRFFTERYNSRRLLTELVEQVRGTRNLAELAKLVERGVDLALHLERVALMVEDPAVGRFVDPRHQMRPLDPGSQLITLVSGSRDPIAVDLEAPSSPFRKLPEDDKLWLIDNRVEMFAPAHSLDGNLIALLVLGAKKSELPFLREDRELLASVCSSAGLVVELLRLKETAAVPTSPPSLKAGLNEGFEPAPETEGESSDGSANEAAMECIACDRVFPPGTTECPHCHVETEKTNAPYILRDLYRLDHRLGTGGMAVVYRAKDLKLGRSVAIKTLPRVNAEAAMRLRREARTAASVSHPGLAAIYGLETWRGVPMIITEYLAGGTLADQLGQDPLDPLAAIDMASTVAQALAKIHNAGILHRDIKPSNIGYSEDGDVKLLDFGIARIQHDFRKERPDDENTVPGPDGSRIVNTASLMLPRTRTGQLVGTVTYLSPEAARGEKADTGVDLWALAVCLYEALTAENLFYGRTFQDVLAKIRDLRIADVRQKAPTCPEPLALFLAEELHIDRSRRSDDGLEMASRLKAVRAKILA